MTSPRLAPLSLLAIVCLAAALPACSCDPEPEQAEGDCGNGVVEENEQCDDGNRNDGDGCSASCSLEVTSGCGDGVQGEGEECDDGNTTAGDGCSETCQNEGGTSCGNGNVDDGEECDDGNTSSGDGCSATCESEPFCGNGIPEAGEECDDENDLPYDGCEDDCTESEAEIECAELQPLPAGTCEVTPGDGQRLIVGDVLMPHTVFRGGQLLVGEDGIIACVGCDCAAMAPGATVVSCPTAAVSPGLINSHDHITYAADNPYNDSGERYEHRHDWRKALNGHTGIPSTGSASDDEIRWGELRFMIGGATSTVGSGSATGFLRNLDKPEQEGLGQDPVNYAVFPLGDSGGTQLAATCNYNNITTPSQIANDDAYFPHISEGIDVAAHNEFLCTASSDGGGEDLLEAKSAVIHGVGLTPVDYARMAEQDATLVWSPRSNVTLYGNTAVVTAAHRVGVRIALGTDWMPTGSMNLQRELQCVDSLNTTYYDGYFTDRDMFRMVTWHGARAAAVDDVVGAFYPGYVADVAIFAPAAGDAFRAVIDALPEHTALVMRGGEVLYGDGEVVEGLAGGGCDLLDVEVCTAQKRLCASADIGKTFADLQDSVGSIYPLLFCSGAPPVEEEPSCKPTRPLAVNDSTVYSGTPGASDADGDGIDDGDDNCPTVFNPARPMDFGVQSDVDDDGEGDACDTCPLHPGVTACPHVTGDDVDGDGVMNDADNCIYRPNAGQTDGDNDDKGDACDVCPGVANAGALACPKTIYEVKEGDAYRFVGFAAIEDALVTACKSGEGYFLQIKEGDANYAGPDYSGIFVYSSTVNCGTTLAVGDRVNVNPALVTYFFGQIQLNYGTVSVASSGEALPDPIVAEPADLVGDAGPGLEGVLVRVEDVMVTALNPPAGPGDSDPTNEFVVDGVLKVNDVLHLSAPFPTVNTPYDSITGVLDFRNNAYKLEPREQLDLEVGNPVLVGFAPALSYVRQNSTGVQTFPVPLEVTLSGPAVGNTVVDVVSDNMGLVSAVGNAVTVLDGETSAFVLVNAPAIVNGGVATFTATEGQSLTADVHVIGSGDTPEVSSISPLSGAVAPNGTLSFDVVLDIPAPPGGISVTLGISEPNGGTGSSIDPTVLVPEDEFSAAFDFTAGPTVGSEEIFATLGGTAFADVNIINGAGLVINEVDYDQPGTDAMEFVEIFNTASSSVGLSGLSLVFINGESCPGGSCPQYRAVSLGSGQLMAGEYLVVGSQDLLDSITAPVEIPFSGAQDMIQNGARDGVALVFTASCVVIDSIIPEAMAALNGAIAACSGTPLKALSEFVNVSDSNNDDGSVIRFPNGSDTNVGSVDWAFTGNVTAGAENIP
jgi:cysteine-rich repeat protein